MSSDAAIRLRKDEDRRIRAGHLWVFSNEIDVKATPLTDLEPGQAVEVQDVRGNFLGRGYVNPHSLIAVRILTRSPGRRIDGAFFAERLSRALELRERMYPDQPYYRLCFGESDRLPGLVVDRFGGILVVQATTAGIERRLDLIVPALVELTGADGVLLRADSPSRVHEGLEQYVRTVHGEIPSTTEISENGVRFRVPLAAGQKTGWFYDHRVNRSRLQDYAPGRRVLDVFSYIGGWGVQAAAFGADEVTCVDSSSAALEQLATNAALNGLGDRVSTIEGDAFETLEQLLAGGRRFDVVVLDPPAFIKRKKDVKKGEQAYRRLNRSAMGLVAEGGILVSASCSFHLSRDALLRAVLWAAERAGREVQVVEEGHQGPDHPIHPAIGETNYLKAFFVRTLS
ncbi:MAG: class I SAM-dependent rRNA methyltransferase [Gemmatimonadota bacterium]